jgi:hypothetical protein
MFPQNRQVYGRLHAAGVSSASGSGDMPVLADFEAKWPVLVFDYWFTSDS